MNNDTTSAPAQAAEPYEQCEQCGTAVEKTQRYCVGCGARRRHVRDPAAQFLSSATAANRSASRPRPASTTTRRSPGLGLALLLAVIPIAVGVGVLAGRASNNGDAKLIAALRAQKPQVITTGAAAGTTGPAGAVSTGAGGSGATAAVALKSTFPLQSGYAVELQTIPRARTTAAAVAAAERAAKAKGATSLGLILQSDFRITPTPPNGGEVIYSGAYRSQTDATKALAKLTKRFPSAKVITVKSASLASGAGKVLAKTSYGTAHQITGFKATSAQLAQGRQVVDKVAKQIGGNYVGSQKNLPDQISVP